jgi:hypothetical protein
MDIAAIIVEALPHLPLNLADFGRIRRVNRQFAALPAEITAGHNISCGLSVLAHIEILDGELFLTSGGDRVHIPRQSAINFKSPTQLTLFCGTVYIEIPPPIKPTMVALGARVGKSMPTFKKHPDIPLDKYVYATSHGHIVPADAIFASKYILDLVSPLKDWDNWDSNLILWARYTILMQHAYVLDLEN